MAAKPTAYEDSPDGVAYRVGKIEDLIIRHDERIKKVEDAQLIAGAGGITMKQLVAVIVAVGTILLTLIQVIPK